MYMVRSVSYTIQIGNVLRVQITFFFFFKVRVVNYYLVKKSIIIIIILKFYIEQQLMSITIMQ